MKKRLVLLFLSLVFGSLCVGDLFAAYLEFLPTTIKQPDGTKIECYASGDEFYNWLHDKDGFTLIMGQEGYYYYGVREGERVIPSAYRVGSVDPANAGLERWAKISGNLYKERRARSSESIERSSVRAPHIGIINNLVVYIRFHDDVVDFTPATRHTLADRFENPSHDFCVNGYIDEASYNQLEINSYHYPVTNPELNLSVQDDFNRSRYQPHSETNPDGYIGDNQRFERECALIRHAISHITTEVPTNLNVDQDGDGKVDNVCFIIKGGNGNWGDLLWCHQNNLPDADPVYINGMVVRDYTFQPEDQADLRVLCHEILHVLGAPDLYRYPQTPGSYEPVGPWDLMSTGNDIPCHMGAWMKYRFQHMVGSDTIPDGPHWISQIPVINEEGTYTLHPITSPTNNAYIILSPYRGNEFFLLEYRKQAWQYETSLPGSGLLVYRICEGKYGNKNGPPDEVYIYRKDGTTTVNGDIDSAMYGGNGRTEIKCENTNPTCFLSNGDIGGLHIKNIGTPGETIQFEVKFLKLNVTPTEYNFGKVHRNNKTEFVDFVLKNTLDCCDTLKIDGGLMQQINIIGADPGDFTLEPITYPIKLRNYATTGDYATIKVRFNPTALGLKTAQIQIGHSGKNSPFLIPLQGEGYRLSVVPDPHDFGSVLVFNYSQIKNFVLSNAGKSTLTIDPAAVLPINPGSIEIIGPNAGDFILGTGGYPINLAPQGGTHTIYVNFHPTGEGLREAQIRIIYNAYCDNAINSIQDSYLVGLSGHGIRIGVTPGEIVIPPVPVCTVSEPVSFTVLNLGEATVTLYSGDIVMIGEHADDFTMEGLTFPINVDPNMTFAVTVRFHTLVAGPRTAVIRILPNQTQPLDVSLSGYGIPSYIIGTGGIANGTTSYPGPYGNYYYGVREQMLIPATELWAAGMIWPGNIVNLGFDVDQVQGTPLQNFTVKLRATDVTTLSTFITDGLQTVWGPATYTESPAWTNHAFHTPFFWDGLSNLLVETSFANSSYTYNAIVNQTATPGYVSTLVYRADSGYDYNNPAINVSVQQRPNIKLAMADIIPYGNDLTASVISGPDQVNISTDCAYTVTVKNTGSNPRSYFDVELLVDGYPVGWATYSGYDLATYETADVTVHWTPQLNLRDEWQVVTVTGRVSAWDENNLNNETAGKTVLVFPAGINAVFVGNGTALANSLPLNFYWKNSLAETIYMAEELDFPPASVITGITYYNNFVSNLTDKPIKIWMGETALTAFPASTSWIQAGSMTLVFEGILDFPSGQNSILINLQTPYIYNGNNLVVLANRVLENSFYDINDRFYYTATTAYPNRSLNMGSDTTVYDPYNITISGARTNRIPNTVFYYTLIDFLEAPVPSVSNVGGDINLSWAAVPGAHSYIIYSATDPYVYAWTQVAITGGLTYSESTDSMKFYRVMATTEAPPVFNKISPTGSIGRE
jgi:M6 family metalloprotease-like protein